MEAQTQTPAIAGQTSQSNGANASNNVPMLEKTPLESGTHTVFSIRPFSKKILINGVTEQRPMWAFNVTDSSRGWYLSHLQLEQAGITDPRMLQGTPMDVQFFEVGEKLISGALVTDGGTIVKSFIPQFNQELLLRVAEKTEMAKVTSWSEAANRARSPRNVGATRNGGAPAQGAGTSVGANTATDSNAGNPADINAQVDQELGG